MASSNLLLRFLADTSQLEQGFKRAGQSINGFRSTMMNANDAIRLASLGMTNFGRSMMFFVGIPLAGAIGAATSEAVSFQDTMVRVQKTTNLSNKSIETLSQNLRNISVNAASSQEELAQIAEVLGQQGMGAVQTPKGLVEMPNALSKMVMIIDQYATATAQSGENAAQALGKITAAYGENINTAGDTVLRLANVINYLENTTAATATEIQTTLMEFSGAAATLNISMSDAAAFSATLVSLGRSASEAATSLNNMVVKVPQHADELAKAMKGVNSEFDTADKIIKAMNNDVTGFFLELIRLAEGGNDRVATLVQLMEIADVRGGRGLANLANNFQLLDNNIKAAEAEWNRTTSLMTEYEKALSSTQSQLKMLKNNLMDLAITAGNVFLPVLNKIIQVAVPGLRMITDAFKKMSGPQQMMIAGFVLALIVIGPLLMFLGQMVHSVSLLTMGLGQGLRVVAAFVSGLSQLVPVIASVGRLFLSWPGMVILAGVAILKVLQSVGVDVAGFFSKLASDAITWGENLAASLANGFLGGAVRYISKAVSYVASIIASFFEAHSPPQMGPLSTIDKWGIGLMKTYLNGFKNADFSILSDVGKMIETALTMGVEDEALPGALRQVAAQREKISKLIAQFNSSGVIDPKMLDEITNGLGEIRDATKQVLTLWLQYNRLQEQIAAIEARRKGVVKTYQDEMAAVAGGNRALQDKIAAIRQLQRNRDDGLRGLDKEKAALEDQSSTVKDQLDYQKNMVSAIQDQQGLFAKIADALDRLSKKGGGAGGSLDLSGAFGGAQEAVDNANKSLQDLMQSALDIKNRFTDGQAAWQGLMDALNGKEPFPDGLFPSAEANTFYMDLYKIGTRIAEVRDTALGAKDKIVSAWETVKGKFEEFKQTVEDVKGSMSNFDPTKLPFISSILQGFGSGFDGASAGKSVADGFKAIQDAVATLVTFLEEKSKDPKVQAFFMSLVDAIGKLIGWLAGKGATVIGEFFGVLEKALAFLIEHSPEILTFFAAFMVAGTIFTHIAEAMMTLSVASGLLIPLLQFLGIVISMLAGPGGVVLLLAAAVGLLAAAWVKNWGNIQGIVSRVGEVIMGVLGPVIAVIKDNFMKLWPGLQAAFATVGPALDTLGQAFSNLGTLLAPFFAQLGQILLYIGGVFLKGLAVNFLALLAVVIGVVGGILSGLAPLITGIVTIFSGIVNIVAGIIDVVVGLVLLLAGTLQAIFTGNTENITKAWEMLKSGVVAIVTGLIQVVVGLFIGIGQTIAAVLQGFVASVVGFFTGLYNTLVGHSIIPDMMREIADTIKSWLDTAVEYVTGFVQKFIDAGKSIIDGLKEGATNAWRDFLSWFEGVIDLLPDVVKKILGIASPSKIFFAIGNNIIQGLSNGIVAMQGALRDTIGMVSSSMIGDMSFVGTSATLAVASSVSDASFAGSSFGGAPAPATINININNPSVRSDRDIDEIVRRVKDEIGKGMNRRVRQGGNNF